MSKCAFCENSAILLCDYIISWDNYENYNDIRVRTSESKPQTCDAPLCADCRNKVGITFFQPELGGPDTRDLCPAHFGLPCSDGIKELSPGFVEAERLKVWKMRYFQKM